MLAPEQASAPLRRGGAGQQRVLVREEVVVEVVIVAVAVEVLEYPTNSE